MSKKNTPMPRNKNHSETHPLLGRLNDESPGYDENNKVLVSADNYYTLIKPNSIKLFNYHAQHNTLSVNFLEVLDQIIKDGERVDKTDVLKQRNRLRQESINNIINGLSDMRFQKCTGKLDIAFTDSDNTMF